MQQDFYKKLHHFNFQQEKKSYFSTQTAAHENKLAKNKMRRAVKRFLTVKGLMS